MSANFGCPLRPIAYFRFRRLFVIDNFVLHFEAVLTVQVQHVDAGEVQFAVGTTAKVLLEVCDEVVRLRSGFVAEWTDVPELGLKIIKVKSPTECAIWLTFAPEKHGKITIFLGNFHYKMPYPLLIAKRLKFDSYKRVLLTKRGFHLWVTHLDGTLGTVFRYRIMKQTTCSSDPWALICT